MDTDSAGASVAKHPQSSDKGLAQVASAGTAPSLLRYAAQPDVVLSLERDAYYADTLLGEGASELVETLLGSRRAMILAPELRAVASCLYFGLTNFAGEYLAVACLPLCESCATRASYTAGATAVYGTCTIGAP